MPLDSAIDDIDADFDVLEAIGRHVDDLCARIVRNGAVTKTLRQWLVGHAEPPENEDALVCLMAMAADLELFTPSPSGKTAVDRLVSGSRPETSLERQALQALGAAQFRLVRIRGREGPDVALLEDLVTGESLRLLDARIAPEAAGLLSAMRLCPLASGRHVVTSPLFAMDEAMLEAAMKLVRPGRPLGHRCAAVLYRDLARRGFAPVPQRRVDLSADDLLEAVAEALRPVEHLALRRMAGQLEETELVAEARRLASADNLVDACGLFAQAGADAPEGLKAAYERIAEVLVETIVQRARAGVAGHARTLDDVAAAIAGHVSRGAMHAGAGDLFRRLRARFDPSASARADSSSSAADLERVVERIRALRAKTVDRGCTEEEAMAAAAKVAELLDRHDLTLDEISVRRSECEGVGVSTGRKRRAPIDGCVPQVAAFCDCRVWSEDGGDGVLRYMFFGLRADVEAARCLHELVEAAFETESAAFRQGDIYLALSGGGRRTALTSFQVGLASGVSAKLADLKAARQGAKAKSTGFDLVAAKRSVVDDEIAKLGLGFTTRTTRRRVVHAGAYAAGKAAGALFQPEPALG